VKPAQQRFWPDVQPLVERLGREFFQRLPETPGVYQMRGAADNVLYVGKAKSLRHRLCSYRVANPDRLARRTLRLLNQVSVIVWEECADEAAALRREAELLLEIKPRFNRAGVWPGPKRTLAWRSGTEGLELAVADAAEDGWNRAGRFGAQAKYLHRALVRLLWCKLNPTRGLAGMPAGWFNAGHGTQVIIRHSDKELVAKASEQLLFLVKGDSAGFIEWLGPVTFPFEQAIRDEDLELLTKHFRGFQSRRKTKGTMDSLEHNITNATGSE
jgi:predicted GIY-YIG superfamily endonuclease